MGYIEDIKKINALAKELLHHHIVGSQDEAVVKAREMLVKKTGSATVQNEEYLDLSKAPLQTPLQEVKRSEEWKEAMAKNNDYIITELKNFRTAMDAMTNEMHALRSELNNVKRLNVQNNPQQAMQPTPYTVTQSVSPQAPVVQETKPAQSAQPHPRAGNYTPADVSVEKFFYFGKK